MFFICLYSSVIYLAQFIVKETYSFLEMDHQLLALWATESQFLT